LKKKDRRRNIKHVEKDPKASKARRRSQFLMRKAKKVARRKRR